MKKLLALSLALTMCLAFAGCGKDSSSESTSKADSSSSQSADSDKKGVEVDSETQAKADKNAKIVFQRATKIAFNNEKDGDMIPDGTHSSDDSDEYIAQIKEELKDKLDADANYKSFTFTVDRKIIVSATYEDASGAIGNYPAK